MTNCDELYKEAEDGQLESMIKINGKNEDSRKSLLNDEHIKIVESHPKETPNVVAKQLSVPKCTSNLFNNPFGSRGSMILKAALSDKSKDTANSCQPNLIYYNRQPLHEKYSSLTSNTNNNNNSNNEIPSTPTTPTSTATGRKSSVYSSEKRRRLARKEVLFADPIVSNRFVYEPTIILDISPSSSPSSSSSSNSDFAESESLNILMNNVTMRSKNLYSPAKMNRTNHVRSLPQVYRRNYSPMANNLLVACDQQLRTPPSIRNSRKRPYIHEINQSPVSKKGTQLSICNADQSSTQMSPQLQHQCLFSPPKVAKIVPYFTDSIARKDVSDSAKDKNANGNQISACKMDIKDANEVKNLKQIDRLDNSDDDVFEDAVDRPIGLNCMEDKPYAPAVTNCNYYSPISNICQSLWSACKQVIH